MLTARLAVFSRDVAALADGLLAGGHASEGDFGDLLEAVEARVQAEVAELRPADAPPPACAPGCAACCTVNVGTLALEGAAAAAFLRSRLGPEALEGLAASLLRFHEAMRWEDDGARVRGRVRCPLLDEGGACRIHPARPLACRALSSLDAGECLVALGERADEDGPGLVRMDLLQKTLYDEASVALSEVLASRGLDDRRRDVSGMTGAFLADPSLASAFASGARVPID